MFYQLLSSFFLVSSEESVEEPLFSRSAAIFKSKNHSRLSYAKRINNYKEILRKSYYWRCLGKHQSWMWRDFLLVCWVVKTQTRRDRNFSWAENELDFFQANAAVTLRDMMGGIPLGNILGVASVINKQLANIHWYRCSLLENHAELRVQWVDS